MSLTKKSVEQLVGFENEEPAEKEVVLRRYTRFCNIREILENRQIELRNTDSWDDKNDKYLLDLYRRHRAWKSIFAICGTRTKKEHYHHWKTYAEDGACIVFDRKKLIQGAKEANFKYGTVRYKMLKDLNNDPLPGIKLLPFFKRAAFSDEREFRIVTGLTDESGGTAILPIKLSWIRKIRLNPWLDMDESKCRIRDLKQISGCQKIDMKRSTLLQSRRWEQFGDSIYQAHSDHTL